MTSNTATAARDWSQLISLTQGREVVVERVRLKESGIAVEGAFELPALAQLSPEEQMFIVAFVRTHGSIKRMESILGVSYPTVKARLNRLGAKLDYVEVEEEQLAEPPSPTAASVGRAEVLAMLESGAISVEEAVARLRAETSTPDSQPPRKDPS